LKKEDVQGKIKIGDVPCELFNYEVSVKIQCVTGPSNTEKTAPIIVGNEAGFTKSSVEFSYKDIKLFGIDPTKGPLSGGTQLAIRGQYLNIGSEITAYLDDYVCQVNLTQASSGRLTCITSRAHESVNIAKLTLSIDGANRTLEGNPFNYTQDPTIMEIKPLKSFVSGGRMIFVHGTNLSSIQAPEMEVYSDGEPSVAINKTSCTVLSATQIECPSPSVNRQFLLASTRIRRSLRQPSAIKVCITIFFYRTLSQQSLLQMPEARLIVKIGFIMDNVQSVKNLDKHFPNLRSQLLYVEDPKFFKFPNQIKLYKGDTLVIEGENLNMASDETDVVVTIGTKPCNVTGLAMSQLVCSPPEQQPFDTDENGVKVF
jgi:plexin A